MSVLHAPTIDLDRLLWRIGALAAIGDTGDGGACRLALTDDDRVGRELVAAWMDELDMRVEVDTIGNIRGTWPAEADAPPVMMGSHIDTVRTGGILDGNLGVLAGLEVVETIAASGRSIERPLCVAVFTDEEGARYPPDMLGSLAFVGGIDLEAALGTVGIDGSVLGEELDRIGFAGAFPCPGPVPHSYVELHIEQGPVLEADGITIGAVTGVQGISWQEVVIRGQSNHAGTTPMSHRHDAGYAAGAVTTFVRDMALEMGGSQVATVGRISLIPDLVNVVANTATLTVDLRNTDGPSLAEAERRLSGFLDELAQAEGVTIETRSLAEFDPVDFDPDIVDLVERTAGALGHTVSRMPSGAGHDAQMLARVCPTGMVFVPSIAGISHNPAEATDRDDLGAGAAVLLGVVSELVGLR